MLHKITISVVCQQNCNASHCNNVRNMTLTVLFLALIEKNERSVCGRVSINVYSLKLPGMHEKRK